MKLDAYWQLEGTILTDSPMHIGNGNAVLHKFESGEESEPAEVQMIACDFNNRPIIPGSALKGVLKRRVEANSAAASAIFGKMETGGLVQFLDATTENEILFDENILRRTAIDAIRGSAEEHLLFAHWMVPAGTAFNVRIRGKSYETGMWRQHAALLEKALSSGVQFGAWSGNDRGTCTWRLGAVRVLDSAAIAAWLRDPSPVDRAFSCDSLKDRKHELEYSGISTLTDRKKKFEITLNFKGHYFLVNDPNKVTQAQDDHAGRSHAARRTANGELILPAESFRGVLAHQAARIARTCGKSGDRQELRRMPDGSLPGDIGCVTRLFGGSGWKSVLEFDDFKQIDDGLNSTTQEFVAIDRFTGAGGMDNRKFNAEGGWQPRLKGALSIDLERLKKLGDPTPSLGLLAMVLRDLADGDLSFGWGSSKGYGWAYVDASSPQNWVESQLNGLASGEVKGWVQAWTERGL